MTACQKCDLKCMDVMYGRHHPTFSLLPCHITSSFLQLGGSRVSPVFAGGNAASVIRRPPLKGHFAASSESAKLGNWRQRENSPTPWENLQQQTRLYQDGWRYVKDLELHYVVILYQFNHWPEKHRELILRKPCSVMWYFMSLYTCWFYSVT